MIYFKKLIKIPGPKDLGMGKSNNAMAIDLFNNNNQPTWESYYARIKKEYPVKYFFASTFPSFFDRRYRTVKRHFTKFTYWVKCHLKKNHRHHSLDLTQPKMITLTNADGSTRQIHNEDHYDYGWIDIDTKMLFAMFNLLNDYVKNELKVITEEDIKKEPQLLSFKQEQDEVLAIHHWWNVERKLKQEEMNTLTDKWYYLSKKKRKLASARAFKESENATAAFEIQTDEMIARLMKIRRTLWS